MTIVSSLQKAKISSRVYWDAQEIFSFMVILHTLKIVDYDVFDRATADVVEIIVMYEKEMWYLAD